MIDVNEIKERTILVVGDVMLDNYVLGEIRRISPEAPVPVLKKVSERSVPGGAANVAANLVAASQRVFLMSVVGKDVAGDRLLELLQERKIDTSLISRIDRCTTIKSRFLAGNHQQVLRMDSEDCSPVDQETCRLMLSMLEKTICRMDIVIISDYAKGLLTYDFVQGIIKLAGAHDIRVLIDVKDTNTQKYCGAYLLKPNRKELHDLTGMSVDTESDIVLAAESLMNRCASKYVLCTLGSKGMVLVGRDRAPMFIAAKRREVFDVSGAGDTTIAYLATAIASGFDLESSTILSNIAASIQVGKVGTSSVSLDEIKESLLPANGTRTKKILLEADLKGFRQRNEGKRIVFTNGCFDILHIGHKRYLEAASKLGDILVVGVNSDDSVRRLKGPDRPINSESDRVEMLSSLSFVDYLTVFQEDTPYELIGKILPDILVKGGDYKVEEVVGRDIVEKHGGRVEILPFVDGKSTTNLITKIRNNE